MKVILEYCDRGYRESESHKIKEIKIEGNTERNLFIQLYKKNEQLRYCGGAYYQFKSRQLRSKYLVWIRAEENEKLLFRLHYGDGVID